MSFYPKQLPKGGSRAEIQAEGISAYETFLSGLLDITDNLAARWQDLAAAARHRVRRR